jgi:hypothetical protein
LALIDLIDNISNSLDNKDYTIGVFLDLSKAFDTINHKILLDKLSYYGIRGLPLIWFTNYLSHRQQFVNFNGIHSQMSVITCGVPQGSILGPILFLLYINDILNTSMLFKFILFADDTNLIFSEKSLTSLMQNVNTELHKISVWFKTNKLVLNPNKTKFIIFTSTHKRVTSDSIKLYIDGLEIEQVQTQKFLGVIINSQLNWQNHINQVCSKMAKAIGIINKIKCFIDAKTRKNLYCTLVLPYINYGNVVWASTYHSKLNKVFKLQKRMVRIIANVGYLSHTQPLFSKYDILSIFELNKLQTGLLMFKCMKMKSLLPQTFQNYFTLNSDIHHYNTRSATEIHIIQPRTNIRKFSFRYSGPHLWNSLPNYLTEIYSIFQFKNKFKYYLRNIAAN